MVPGLFLERAIVVLTSVLIASVAFVLGHGAWLTLSRRHTAARLERGRAALRGVVSGGEATAAERAAVASLPAYVQDRLLTELARVFGGAIRDRLREIAVEIGAVRRAEGRLRSRAWWRRLRGVRFLAAVGASEELVLEQ